MKKLILILGAAVTLLLAGCNQSNQGGASDQYNSSNARSNSNQHGSSGTKPNPTP